MFASSCKRVTYYWATDGDARLVSRVYASYDVRLTSVDPLCRREPRIIDAKPAGGQVPFAPLAHGDQLAGHAMSRRGGRGCGDIVD